MAALGYSRAMPRIEIRMPRTEGEAMAYAWAFFHSLVPVAQPTQPEVAAFLERIGISRMRAAFLGGEIVGGLVLLDMAQFFGGASVPMTGVSAVAVLPEHRSQGVGSALLRSALAEMARRRVALSGLYPATQPVYRRLGWEIAGVRQQWRLSTSSLALGERAPRVRRMLTEDEPAVKECYRRWAATRAGQLDRIEWCWSRVMLAPDKTVRGYVIDAPRGRGLEGYVVLTREPGESFRSTLVVRDLVALTSRALRRLLSLLGDHRSIAPSALMHLGPGDAAFAHTVEQERALERDWRWMLRIVDVERAIAARGYAAGLSCEAAVVIEDEQVRGNAGRWSLACAGGRGSARKLRGSVAPGVTLHVRGLAAMYTGHASAEEVALMGLASGPPEQLAQLSSMFAGPAPWTSEMW